MPPPVNLETRPRRAADKNEIGQAILIREAPVPSQSGGPKAFFRYLQFPLLGDRRFGKELLSVVYAVVQMHLTEHSHIVQR